MNRTDINNFLTNPDLVANASKEELRRLVETYPYCEALHWMYLRALYIADDAMFDEELMLHGMHISNRRLFFNYLTYQKETDLNSPPVLGGVPEEGGGSQLSTKYAVVLGNEVKGVQQSVIDQCEGCIELPQFGTKHSLNVSVTAGIVIWEFFKSLHDRMT